MSYEDATARHLVDLAQEIEHRLDAESSVNRISAPSDRESPDNNDLIDPSLSPDEQAELGRIQGALKYLNQLRCRLDSQPTNQNSRRDTSDSTKVDVGHDDGDCLQNSNVVSQPSFENFGRFEIKRVLGQGGFARVFLARDPHLDRLIALKVPRPSALISDESRARFERESRAVAILSHPNIVPIFETGSFGSVNYIASEYYPGETLDTWIQTQSRDIDPRIAVTIIAELAGALQHAHQRGVIHRDLKPGNILVLSEKNSPEELSLRITDFGLARLVDCDQFVTQEGSIIGTPAYMSPEQSRGENETTYASDLYSLGTIFYELLTGKLPHLGNDHVATIHSIQFDEPASLRKIRPTVPRDLEAICLKCLHKNPVARYASAHDLQLDLTNWLEGRPVVARRTTWVDRVGRWCRRNPWLAASGLLLFLSLATGMSLTYWQWRESQANLTTTLVERDRALGHLGELEGTVDLVLAEFGSQLNANEPLDDSQRRILDRMLVVHRSLIRQESENLNITDELIGNYLRICEILRLLGEYEQSYEYSQTAIRLIDSIPDSHPHSAEFQRRKCSLLFNEYLIARSNESPRNAEQALLKLIPLLEDEGTAFTEIERLANWQLFYRRLGIVYQSLREFEQAEAACLKSLDYMTRVMSLDERKNGNTGEEMRMLFDLGTINWSLTNREIAVEYFEQSIDVYDALPIELQEQLKNRLFLAACRTNYGHALRRLGEPEKSLHQFQKADDAYLQLTQDLPRESRLGRTLVLQRTIEVCTAEEMWDEAEEACDQGLEIIIQLPSNVYQTKTHIAFLAFKGNFLRRKDRDSEQAKFILDEAVRIAKSSVNAYPNSGAHYIELGRAHCFLGRWYAGREEIKQASKEINDAFDSFARCHQLEPFRQSPKTLPIEVTTFRFEQAMEHGDVDEAIKFWDRLVELAPEENRFYFAAANELTNWIYDARSAGDEIDPATESRLKLATLHYFQQAIDRGFNHTKPIESESAWRIWDGSVEFLTLFDQLKELE